ncbi:MAG: hypothetical protein IAF94_14810 [Pirellulaceae bacterium]|nr:hypothetical protein [Pirellulaceae bacterium]
MDTQAASREIEDLLFALIPRRVGELRISVPVYCLMVKYLSGSEYGDTVPSLELPADSLRQQIQKEKGNKAPYFLWSHFELPHCPEVFTATIHDPTLLAIVRLNPDLANRKLAQIVALRLNALDWSQVTSVTDDFVVIAADETQEFGDTFGDIKASIGEERLANLRARKLIGSESWYHL